MLAICSDLLGYTRETFRQEIGLFQASHRDAFASSEKGKGYDAKVSLDHSQSMPLDYTVLERSDAVTSLLHQLSQSQGSDDEDIGGAPTLSDVRPMWQTP
jgi:hypothetical protein